MSRKEFFHDPAAPAAELVAPSVFAAVRDDRGRLLLVCRVDNGNWELPGGQVDVGDTVVSALHREVAEEPASRSASSASPVSTPIPAT